MGGLRGAGFRGRGLVHTRDKLTLGCGDSLAYGHRTVESLNVRLEEYEEAKKKLRVFRIEGSSTLSLLQIRLRLYLHPRQCSVCHLADGTA